jgi:hypothetical protein
MAGQPKPKPKKVKVVNDPQAYIADGMKMMMDHIVNLQIDNQQSKDNSYEGPNLNYAKSVATT